MKIGSLVCIFYFLFLGCSHPRTTEEWAMVIDTNEKEEPIAARTFFSGLDSLQGLELEFVRGAKGYKAFINVAGATISGSLFAQVTVQAGSLQHSFLAKILPGRKRLEIPSEVMPHIATALEKEEYIDVSIAFTPYKTRVLSKSFNDNMNNINDLALLI